MQLSWWNPDESGSRYSVEVQGGKLFIVGFMYGGTGRPVWYFSARAQGDRHHSHLGGVSPEAFEPASA